MWKVVDIKSSHLSEISLSGYNQAVLYCEQFQDHLDSQVSVNWLVQGRM